MKEDSPNSLSNPALATSQVVFSDQKMTYIPTSSINDAGSIGSLNRDEEDEIQFDASVFQARSGSKVSQSL